MNKKELLKIHRWIGIILAILLTVQGLTGVVLVFREEIERAIHPALVLVALPDRVPLQKMLDKVQAAHAEFSVDRIEFSARKTDAVIFRLVANDGSRRLVAVDPFRNSLVRDGPMLSWPVELVFYIHHSLLAGSVGHYVIGLEGLALLFLGVTGPVIWWPGGRRVRSGLTVTYNRGADIAWRTSHRTCGAISATLLGISALTGCAMVWKGELRDFIGTWAPMVDKPSPVVKALPNSPMVRIDRLIAFAREDYGDNTLRQVRFVNQGRVAVIFLARKGAWYPEAVNQIYYDRYTGREVARYVEGELPVATEAMDLLFPIHAGTAGGVVTRLLVVISGTALVGLSVSGLWLWNSRRTRGARTNAKPRRR